jgi:hypothetical protein
MPFKTVSQPRRVASLEGSIQGASFHKKLGTVAMVSTNPVQVVTVAHTGSPAKNFSVQLEEARDIALLSRDMAVVRTDTDVWQLLDIQHKARVDPLTRDSRMIVGPQGDAALALKWDNSCEQLTPGKNEVASRTFPGAAVGHHGLAAGCSWRPSLTRNTASRRHLLDACRSAAGDGLDEGARASSSGGARRLMPSVPSMGPGAMPTTRTPRGPHSTARVRVIASTAAFAAEAWICSGVAA